ncbi:MAG TPA: peptide chain release factor N(5)-glutamine methyltransferase [Promineifilum sp.]
MTTIREAWRSGRAQLRESPSPALDARLLLEHVLGRDHAYLIAHDADEMAAADLAAYLRLIERAAAHEPIPYLIGHAPFLGLSYAVSHDVLIPRPETEQLVESAIEWAKGRGAIRVVDVGTGSGCLAVSLARHLPQATVYAVDLSNLALDVARRNVARHASDSVQLVCGDLLESFASGLDLVVANLPYVAEADWPLVSVGVKSFEPVLALYGGADGLDLFRKLLPQAAERLSPDGLLLMEIGWQQGKAVSELALAAFPRASIEVRPDFGKLDRIVAVQNHTPDKTV